MERYKEEFIEFMIASEVLKFGSFTLKSGRVSPFFMNAGAYVTGGQIRKLGAFLFGPAYKGIPLAVATACAISELYGKEVRYCANRKEAKDHGDKGILLGSSLQDGDRVVIIEDVTTSGASMAETVPILRAQAKVDIKGLIVSLNRQEKGLYSDRSALAEIQETYGFPASAIVTMEEVIQYLDGREVQGKLLMDDVMKKAIEDYYKEYGAR